MIAAGIDVVLPVFWGAPSEQDSKSPLHWSYEGLPPLVQAREELLRAGRQPPRIGLFEHAPFAGAYSRAPETTTLQGTSHGIPRDSRSTKRALRMRKTAARISAWSWKQPHSRSAK